MKRCFIKQTHTDINLQDKYGYSALHYACRNNHVHVVQKILSTYDVNINLVTNGGATPLMRAAMAPKTDSLGSWFLQLALTCPPQTNMCSVDFDEMEAELSAFLDIQDTKYVQTTKEILLNDKRILTDPIDEEGQNFLHKLCRKFATSPANQNAQKFLNNFPDLAKVKDKYGKMPFEYFDPNISKLNIND